jgi:hypothetical protein
MKRREHAERHAQVLFRTLHETGAMKSSPASEVHIEPESGDLCAFRPSSPIGVRALALLRCTA